MLQNVQKLLTIFRFLIEDSPLPGIYVVKYVTRDCQQLRLKNIMLISLYLQNRKIMIFYDFNVFSRKMTIYLLK